MRIVTSLLLSMLFVAPGFASPPMAVEGPMSEAVLLAPWEGPHGGLPPFDRVKTEQFAPAFATAMAACHAEIDRIAQDKAKPNFANTIAALEDSCRSLKQVSAIYGVWSSTMSSAEFQDVEAELEPKLAAFYDAITQNEALFGRIDAVWKSRSKAKLTPEQARVLEVTWKRFVREGAAASPEQKTRLAEINQQLAGLYTEFNRNLLADEETYLLFDDAGALAGLSAADVSAAAATATEKGHPGKWAITNTRSSVDPVLTFVTRRDVRERVWKAFIHRGDNSGPTDNKPIITKILALRAERAKLLGFPTHAHWRLTDSMAGTPEKAMALMEAVWKPAVARVHEEVADQQKLADADGIRVEPWDYRFYMEKVRKARYDLDQNDVKPYLQLEKLREAMFWAAGELYGYQFVALTGVPVYHPDVRVWQVNRDGKEVGLWYFDPYARPGKKSGAWMSEYRTQEDFEAAVTPIVSNNSNFVKGAPGEPVLISWDDANTLFHEFGHALHGLSSNVHYPTLAGTNTTRDHVEFPSQLNEHWLSTPQVLNRFALHAQTGEPIPATLVERIEKTSTFNQGFATVEYLSSALIDMKLHLAGVTAIDPDKFERETLDALGMPRELVMRHRTPQFGHIFSSDGYSAGYYSYLWADTLTADAAEAFEAAGSMYDPATARRYFEMVLSVGNTIDPADGFRRFRGRDVDTQALLRDRGFAPAKP